MHSSGEQVVSLNRKSTASFIELNAFSVADISAILDSAFSNSEKVILLSLERYNVYFSICRRYDGICKKRKN